MAERPFREWRERSAYRPIHLNHGSDFFECLKMPRGTGVRRISLALELALSLVYMENAVNQPQLAN
jgi:hypothetical protein